MRKLLLVGFVIALLASGCFPYHYTMRPGVSGRLVDAATDAPIPGADVHLKRYERELMFNDKPPEEVAEATGSDGAFSIPARKTWGLYIVPMDVFNRKWTVTIEASGYQKYESDLSANPMGQSEFELGAIRLQKQ
jgi:hypothetical protein